VLIEEKLALLIVVNEFVEVKNVKNSWDLIFF